MKKLLCLMAAILLVITTMSGCNKTLTTDNENTLVIHFIEAGYGRKFVDDLAAEFMKENPGVKVEMLASSIFSDSRSLLLAGPKSNKADLMLTTDMFFDIVDDGPTRLKGYDCLLEDITDVYNGTIEGESRKVTDKLSPAISNYFNVNGKYYMVPWAGPTAGIIYNKGIFDKNPDWKLPKTTIQLIDLCISIKSSGKKAFIFSGGQQFFKSVYTTWWAQYQGTKSYFDFWKGIDETGVMSSKVFLQGGRYEALKVLENILKFDNGYTDPNSLSYKFADAQMAFLRGDAMMMPNGDWLENEMRNSFKPGSVDIAFMKMPVISSLGIKLGINDSVLAQAVDYADGVSKTMPDLKATVSEADGADPSFMNLSNDEKMNYIRDARNMVFNYFTGHTAIIPAYANAKDLAKKFLRFMASDKGEEIYIKATNGNMPAFLYDIENNPSLYNSLSSFQKSRVANSKNAIPIFEDKSNKFFFRTGLVPFSISNTSVETALGAQNPADRKTAYECIKYDYDSVDYNWKSLLDQAGIK